LRSSGGLEPGALIRKKYEILSEIGRGGMGVVYRARHLIWNEEKALKVLVAAGAAAQQGLKGLMAEALVMRQLQHPHIVRVEDADYTEDDQPFVVMEYVDGQSLRQKLDGEGPLAPDLALQIAAQTCSALSAAHQKGIIHRDIKPQNLLLAKNADGSETVKVIDFGIAKVREEAGLGFTGMMTGTTGFFVGTPGYASPEQALGMRGSDLDGRTDLYSLGLVLYEMPLRATISLTINDRAHRSIRNRTGGLLAAVSRHEGAAGRISARGGRSRPRVRRRGGFRRVGGHSRGGARGRTTLPARGSGPDSVPRGDLRDVVAGAAGSAECAGSGVGAESAAFRGARL
jgi:serine/threonine protein kinase